MVRHVTRHDALITKTDNFFKKAGFITDQKVIVELDEDGTPKQYEFDVCAKYQEILIIIECKSGSNQDLKNLILEWVTKKTKI